MPEFAFSRERVVQLIESYGVDLRPPISVRDDRQHMQQFYNIVSESHRELFEALAQGPNEFVIKKAVPLPGGRGQAEMGTFKLHPRGAVFTFPIRIPAFDDDLTWPADLNTRVIDSLRQLIRFFPHVKIVRLGKIQDAIYGCDEENPAQIVRERFLGSVLPEEPLEAGVSWNEGNEDHNVVFEIRSVLSEAVITRTEGGQTIQERQRKAGIQVKIDVNNRKIEAPLALEALESILEFADEVRNNRLPEVLTP